MNRKILFFLFILFVGCDFSPPLNKKILEAQSLILAQKYQKAIDKYLEVLKRNPSLEAKVKILYQVGDLYSLYLNRPEQGIKYFKEILIETDDPLWLVRSEEKIAEISFQNLRNFEESYKSYKKLTNFRPSLEKKDFYEFSMGLSLLKNNKFDDAIEIFDDITRRPNNPFVEDAIFQMAVCYFHLKNWEDSTRYLTTFIRRSKRRDKIVEAKYLLANIYETTEQLKNAYDLYYSILGEYPNTRVLKNRLEAIYQRKVVRKR